MIGMWSFTGGLRHRTSTEHEILLGGAHLSCSSPFSVFLSSRFRVFRVSHDLVLFGLSPERLVYRIIDPRPLSTFIFTNEQCLRQVC